MIGKFLQFLFVESSSVPNHQELHEDIYFESLSPPQIRSQACTSRSAKT